MSVLKAAALKRVLSKILGYSLHFALANIDKNDEPAAEGTASLMQIGSTTDAWPDWLGWAAKVTLCPKQSVWLWKCLGELSAISLISPWNSYGHHTLAGYCGCGGGYVSPDLGRELK